MYGRFRAAFSLGLIMKIWKLQAAAFAAATILCVFGARPGHAQNAPSLPVFTTCGSASYTSGNLGLMTLDIHGNLCFGGAGSSPTNPSYVAPYPFTPLTPGQHNLAITTATALTVPTGATYATICASGANVNYTTDGTTTPTASVGQPLLLGQCEAFSGATVLANFKAIQQSATATLNIEYFK